MVISYESYEMTTHVRFCSHMTFELYFMGVEIEPFFNRKHNDVMDDVMTLGASSQMLCNVWLYHFMI